MTSGTKIGLTVGAVMLTLCGVGGYAITRTIFDYPYAARELDAAVAEAKQLGLPWEAKDLAPNPPVREAENAAPLLIPVFKALDSQAPAGRVRNEAINKAAGANATPAQRQAALKENGSVLANLDRALQKDRFWMDRDWDEGAALLFPEYAATKSAVKLLTVRAEVKREAGNFHGAADDLAKAQRLARMIGEEPILIAGLVNLACESIVYREVEELIEKGMRQPAALKEAERLLATSLPRDLFAQHLRGEVYMGIATIRNLRRSGGIESLTNMGEMGSSEPDPSIPLLRTGVPQSVAERAFLARHLQAWSLIFRDIRSGRGPLEISRRADAIAQEMEEKRTASHVLNAILFPVFSQAGAAYVRVEANRRALQGLSKVVAYRTRTGRCPATLAAAGFNETDPFDGKPMRMVVKGEQVRVYSVGADGKDDGGVMAQEQGKSPQAQGVANDVAAIYPSSLRNTWPKERRS